MRSKLVDSIKNFEPSMEEEYFKDRFIELITSQERCFYRDVFDPGHVTGSALLLDKTGHRVLMNHHKSLDKWLCFGGHADGNEDIFDVARREVIEESGITEIEAISGKILDLDIHPIPENAAKGEPAHAHFDVRYLFRALNDNFIISDESLDIRWCSFDEALALDISNDMRRLLLKAQAQASKALRLSA